MTIALTRIKSDKHWRTLTKPYQRWHEDCIVFLDDCFASDKAIEILKPYFSLKDFRVEFPGERRGKENGVKDKPVIEKCHRNKWLLLTQDHDMGNTHVEDIKANPHICILAAAHNAATPEEYIKWIQAVVKLRATILRYYKKKDRPWFATFTIEGNISSFRTITAQHSTRRTKKK